MCVSAGRQSLHFGLSWREQTERLQRTCWGKGMNTHTHFCLSVLPGHFSLIKLQTCLCACVCEACRSCCCVRCGESRSMWLCFRLCLCTHTPVTQTAHTSPLPSTPCYDSESSHRRYDGQAERWLSASSWFEVWSLWHVCVSATNTQMFSSVSVKA